MSGARIEEPTGAVAAVEPEKAHVAREFKHDKPLISCLFDPKGRYVFAGSQDYTIRRWDLNSDKTATLTEHESWAFALACSPDGETLYSGGCEGRLAWWPLAAEAPTASRAIAAHDGWIRCVAASPDGKLVASCGNDRLVKVWSAETGELVRTLPGHEKLVYSIAWSPDGKALASGDIVGRVVEWDAATGKERRRLDGAKLWAFNGGQMVDYGGIRDLSYSADGKYLACAGLIEASNPLGAVSTPAVVVFNLSEEKEGLLQRPKEDIKGVGWGMRYHPSGFEIMVSGGSSGGFLFFFKPDQGNEFFKFGLPNIAKDMDLHVDGMQVLTAHHDGVLRLTRMQAKA